MKKITNIFLAILCFVAANNANAQLPEKAEDISPLLIGEILPKAILQDTEGNSVELRELLEERPTVLVFYRGGWCPFCNLQLSGLANIENEIIELGFQIIAISPDDYQNLNTTLEKDGIKYKLFSDPLGKLINEIGIAFQTPANMKEYITNKGQKGEVSSVMTVPTVMIVNKLGVIQFEHINPNYKERINEELLLSVLKIIKEKKI